MLRPRLYLLSACFCSAFLASAPAQDASKAFLLDVRKGQIPNDTGMEDQTKMSLVDLPQLGGKALKVQLVAEDSFGVSKSREADWKKFERLRFVAFNPGADIIKLELNVVHSGSKAYETRIARDVELKPGKSEHSLPIAEMTNVDGSAPELGQVMRWYFADGNQKPSTFYFGDVWLESGEAPPSDSAPVSAAAVPAALMPARGNPQIGYRVQGRIGDTEVDLTFTPFVVSLPDGSATAAAEPAAAAPVVELQIDEARLARLRAAKMPAVTKPVSFETAEADAIVSALEVFPPDNPLNLAVTNWPLHGNSANIIASIGGEKPLRYNPDMAYVLVPPAQARVPVKISVAAESDPGPFPVPANLPIEGWPALFHRENSPLTLDQLQRNTNNDDGDRHAIVVDPVNRMLYEFYQMQKTRAGWQATQASTFDLKTNKLRPDSWTSADAAGLPMFPLTVRHDEIKRGAIEHALRITVEKTRQAYVYPATHYASERTDENLPRMGERIRLRQDYNVAGHTPAVRVILEALKKYGALVADNGIDWAISVTPDPRIPDLHNELRKLHGSDFEVVEAPSGYQPAE